MRAGARCLSGEGAALELATSARRAALVVVGLAPVQGHCPSEKPLSFGARLWHDVPATASYAKPAAARAPSARLPALTASREKAQHSNLLRARRAALILVASDTRQGHCTGERHYSRWRTTVVRRTSYGLRRKACRRV